MHGSLCSTIRQRVVRVAASIREFWGSNTWPQEDGGCDTMGEDNRATDRDVASALGSPRNDLERVSLSPISGHERAT